MLKMILHKIMEQTNRYIKDNGIVVFFFGLFTLGMVFGCVGLQNTTNTTFQLSLAFEYYIQARSGAWFVVVLRSIITNGIPLFLCYCFGLFMYGYIPCSLLLLIQGFGFGATSGFIYTTYHLKGVAFVLLVILPVCLLNVFVLLTASREAFRFSLLLSKNYFADTVVANPVQHLKRYHLKFLIFFGFAIGISLLDSLFSCVFMDVFGF